jgi:hypothetical protein
MNRDDQWEKPWHSIPITAMPVRPVGLQSAVGLVIEKQSGGGDVGKRLQAIRWKGEFRNMLYSVSKRRVDLEEKAELARAERIQSAARNWLKEQLQRGKLRVFRDGGPSELWVCESQFWRKVDRAGVFMQNSILDREGDRNGAYVLDAEALMALLGSGPAAYEVEDAGYVTAGAPTTSEPSRPATETATPNGPRRGRKKGSGTKDDDSSLRAMLDLLAGSKALTVSAAARMFVEKADLLEGNTETSKESWSDRLRHKFSAKFGTEPPSGKIWDDVRKAGGV